MIRQLSRMLFAVAVFTAVDCASADGGQNGGVPSSTSQGFGGGNCPSCR